MVGATAPVSIDGISIDVEFTLALRTRTQMLAATMHRLHAAHETPPAQPAKHCDRCSLIDICLPQSTARVQVAARWQDIQRRQLQAEPKD